LIVSGEKEGPISPTPKKTNSILFSDNSVLFDNILIRFMGYKACRFALLKEAEKNRKLFAGDIENCFIDSNVDKFKVRVSEFESGYKFAPSQGWKGYLGKK